MSSIREHQLKTIISELNNFGIETSTSKASYFLWCGHHLIPVHKVLKNPRHFLRFIKQGNWLSAIIKLPFCARSIQVKNNIRIYGYNKKDVTAKIALNGIFRNGSLFREVHARKLLQKHYSISFKIPQITSYSPRGNWLIEDEIIHTRKPSHNNLDFFLNHGTKELYSPTLKLRQIKDFKHHGITYSDIEHIWDNVKQIRDLNYAYAFTHGDISRGNMLQSIDGELYVIDWENYSINPIAYDLRTLYKRAPNLRSTILKTLKTLTNNQKSKVARPELQMALALAFESAIIIKDNERHILYFKQTANMRHEDARIHVTNILDQNTHLISELTENNES